MPANHFVGGRSPARRLDEDDGKVGCLEFTRESAACGSDHRNSLILILNNGSAGHRPESRVPTRDHKAQTTTRKLLFEPLVFVSQFHCSMHSPNRPSFHRPTGLVSRHTPLQPRCGGL